jgi:hypothetical protein
MAKAGWHVFRIAVTSGRWFLHVLYKSTMARSSNRWTSSVSMVLKYGPPYLEHVNKVNGTDAKVCEPMRLWCSNEAYQP